MKRLRTDGPVSSHLRGRILIDGNSPRNPKPELISKRSESQYATGRQRSTDLKGLVTEIIEDIYPPLTCPVCFEFLKTRVDGDSHLKARHTNCKPYECLGDCNQAYSSRGGLRYHLLKAHKVEMTINKSVLETMDIDTHPVKKSRVNPRPSPRIASKSLPEFLDNDINGQISPKDKVKNVDEPGGFTKALQKKLDELYPVIVCPACKENFTKKTHVIRHLVQEHKGEEPYECIVPNCKRTKRYATREGLIYHLVNHHN